MHREYDLPSACIHESGHVVVGHLAGDSVEYLRLDMMESKLWAGGTKPETGGDVQIELPVVLDPDEIGSSYREFVFSVKDNPVVARLANSVAGVLAQGLDRERKANPKIIIDDSNDMMLLAEQLVDPNADVLQLPLLQPADNSISSIDLSSIWFSDADRAYYLDARRCLKHPCRDSAFVLRAVAHKLNSPNIWACVVAVADGILPKVTGPKNLIKGHEINQLVKDNWQE